MRAGADQAVVRAAVVRDGRDGGARGRDQPRPGQPGPGQPVAAAAGPRAARPGAHGAVRPRGPGPGQGRPVRAPALPRRPAGAARARGWPASAPTTTGCSSSATPCSRPPALARAGRRAGRRRCPRSTSGTRTSPAPAPSCSAARLGLVDDAAAATSARPTRRSPAGADPRRRRRSTYRAVVRDVPDGAADRDELAEALLDASSSAAATTSSTAASPWSARTATTCALDARAAAGEGLRLATASPGRSRSRCGWRPTTCCAPTATTRS